jgi:hypothetical protein
MRVGISLMSNYCAPTAPNRSTPCPARSSASTTAKIYGDWLGLSAPEIAALEKDNVI